MYTEQVVSFIDILGFKHLIESKTCEEMLEIHDAFYQVNKEEGEELLGFKIINFSDSIVRSATHNAYLPHHPIVYEVLALLDIQWKLIYCHDVLIRGAVTIGDLYVNRTDEKATVFGKALNEAYRLESKKAKYPRIIIDKNALKKLDSYDQKALSNLLKKDDSDDCYFINYLNCEHSIHDHIDIEYKNFLEKHKKVCEQLLEKGNQEKDEGLLEKGIWLKNYHNKHISHCISNLKSHPELQDILDIATLEQLLIHDDFELLT